MARSGIFSRLRKDTAGNALAIMAAALVPTIGLVGGGLDLGIAYMARAKMQNACDAGVLAARQYMTGNIWNNAAEAEARKFFDFNFPAGTHDVQGLQFAVDQNSADTAELLGSASARVPTTLMSVLGFDDIDIAVDCNAKKETGHNDIMLVLDVTGSMRQAPSADSAGSPKIGRLRVGALGLYKALDSGDPDSITRFGFMPYSHTVNTGGLLTNDQILDQQVYESRFNAGVSRATVPASGASHVTNRSYAQNEAIIYSRLDPAMSNAALPNSALSPVNTTTAKNRFRAATHACIEERPSVGITDGSRRVTDTITEDDVDLGSSGPADRNMQFGRYDRSWVRNPFAIECPSRAVQFAEYGNLGQFQSRLAQATNDVGGATYHDLGMLWALRLLSREGMFASQNPETVSGAPVTQHIVFMTDGILFPNRDAYSSYGTDSVASRVEGSGSLFDRHLSRFESACDLAKERGIQVWVIALDVTSVDDIRPCASSSGHFYTSDGTDLEEVFSSIGKKIGSLRLTK